MSKIKFVGKKDKATGFVLAFDGSGVVTTLRSKNRDRQIEGKLLVGNVKPREGKEVRING